MSIPASFVLLILSSSSHSPLLKYSQCYFSFKAQIEVQFLYEIFFVQSYPFYM